MMTIFATIRNGRIEPLELLELPEGTALQITLPSNAIDTDDGPMNLDEIAQALEAMDRMEPLQMKDAELAAWEVDR